MHLLDEPNKVCELGVQYVLAKSLILAATHKLDQYVTSTPISVPVLSEKLGFHPHACKRFLRVLDAYDIISLQGNEVTQTTHTSKLASLISPHLLDAYLALNELEYSLRDNTSCWEKTYDASFFPYLSTHPEKLQAFSEWCSQSGRDWLPGILNLYNFSSFNTLVDVGGGQGQFLSSILSKNPQQKGVLFDQPDVIDKAFCTPELKNCFSQVTLIGGDFFKEEIPQQADCYILCRVLLNWNNEKAIAILNNCKKAMPPHSKLLIIDYVIPDKTHPAYKRTVLSDLNLLAIVNSTNRTQEEWENLVNQSELKLINVIISDQSLNPEPFTPIIILECSTCLND